MAPVSVWLEAPRPDHALAAAIDKAAQAGSQSLERMDRALPYLFSILRDSERYLDHAVTMAAVALGHMLMCDKAPDFARRLHPYLGRFGTIRADDPRQERFRPDPKYRSTQRLWWLSQAWAYHLYQHRNSVMHLDTCPEGGWTANEHLLVIRWLMPRLAKLLLEADGFYELTHDDQADLWMMLDCWLNHPRWFGPQDDKHAITSILTGKARFQARWLLEQHAEAEQIRAAVQASIRRGKMI
ncbi:hypothetical protein [Geminicoccus harenae]|uniref:hypothetical protein n=1 Tax=Geminicoccus harenae TaxID=2498453 RepID=UPI00168B7002|nr:hypothetical protein [Geminicoccus harenae]